MGAECAQVHCSRAQGRARRARAGAPRSLEGTRGAGVWSRFGDVGLVICQRFHQLCPVLVRVYCDIFLV